MPVTSHSLRGTVLICSALLLLQSASAVSFGTKLEPGARECFTEVVDAGGTLAFNFRVTDGGSFDVHATLSVTRTPPLRSAQDIALVHYRDFLMGMRDRQVVEVLNEWTKASEGSHSYTAASAQESHHGLPSEVTVCFDNSFSTISPKWIQFTFHKRDAPETNPDAVQKVEAAMEERLHKYGTIMFTLGQDADRLRLLAASNMFKSRSVTQIIICALLLNVMTILTISFYQYRSLTHFMHRLKERQLNRIGVDSTH